MARTASKKSQMKTLEQRLWDAADALRGNQEPSEYKHVVLGLVFLKYISDRFEERHLAIESALSNPASTDYDELGRSKSGSNESRCFTIDRGLAIFERGSNPRHQYIAIKKFCSTRISLLDGRTNVSGEGLQSAHINKWRNGALGK